MTVCAGPDGTNGDSEHKSEHRMQPDGTNGDSEHKSEHRMQ